MQSLICQQCRAALNWDGHSEIVRCEFCGTRYRMHPRQQQSDAGGVRVGLGEVSNIQTSRGRYAGYALVRSFIPKGWSVQTNAPEQESNILCPLTVQVQYAAPGGDAVITFTGTRAFRHLEPSPQTMQQQGQLILPERMIGLTYRDAGAICDGALSGNPAVSDVRLLSAETQPDDWAAQLMRRELEGFAAAGTLNPGGTWAKKCAFVRDSAGAAWRKQIEAMVLYAYLPVSQGEQMAWQMLQQSRARTMNAMMGLRGGMLGGLLGGMASPQMQAPQPKLNWTVQYMIETSVKEGSAEPATDYHRKIRDSIAVLPLMEREIARLRESLMLQIQQDNAAVSDAMAQMNRDQMASWDRRQQIIRDASDYSSGVMHQMFQDNAATSQRVNNLRSEAIRGVNTYYTQSPGYGVPNVVEAGVGWDHVYQNTQYPDLFAASTGEAPLEFGVDFEELKQTGGDY